MIPFMGGRKTVTPVGIVTKHRNGMGKSFMALGRYLKEGHRLEPDAVGMESAGDQVVGGEGEGEAPPRVLWSETHNVPATSIDAATRYMHDYAFGANSRVQYPVYHFGVSLDPEERLSRDQWQDVVDTMRTRLGVQDHQAMVVAHGDKAHSHVHVVLNRVGPDGKTWKPRHDRRILQSVAREMEIKYGLRRVPTLRDRRMDLLKERGVLVTDFTDSPLLSADLAERVRHLRAHELDQAKSWEDLEKQLAAKLVFLKPAKRGTGLVLTDGYDRMNFSSFNRSYSGPRLASRLGESYRQYTERKEVKAVVEAEEDLGDLQPAHDRAEELLKKVSQTRAVFGAEDLERLAKDDPERDLVVRMAMGHNTVVEVSPQMFTLKSVQELERQLIASADRLHASAHHALDRVAVESLLASKYSYLNESQRAAVMGATTGQDLHMIIGYAGAGKTTLTNAIAESYQDAGYQVLGAAPTGAAAERQQDETGLESRTLASWAITWKDRPPAPNTVIVVDEAGLADTATMAQLTATADAAGVKLVPVGDGAQLKPVGAGDPFPYMTQRYGASLVDQILRQSNEVERQASQLLSQGRVSEALEIYRRQADFHLYGTSEQAIDAMIEQHFAHANLHPAETQVIITHQNAHVAEITERIREARKNIGELQGELSFRGKDFAAGDLIRFRRNDHRGRHVRNLDPDDIRLGVKNGTVGTVTSVSEDQMIVRLQTGRVVVFDPTEFRDFVHGYAMTIHASQGLTVDRASVLSSQTMNRNLATVAFTRHRHGLKIYADKETFASYESFEKVHSRAPRDDMASSYEEVPQFPDSELDYLEQTLPGLYQSPGEAYTSLVQMHAAAEHRSELLRELAEEPSVLGPLNRAPDAEALAQMHLRNAAGLAAEEGSPTAEVDTIAGSSSAAERPPSLTKGAERRLRDASASLSRWDRLAEDLQRVTEMRSALPDKGDVVALERRLQPLTPLPADAAHQIYREPEVALVRFGEISERRGVVGALEYIKKHPKALGELRGHRVLRPEAREKALAALSRLAEPERLRQIETVPPAYRSARELTQRQMAIQSSMRRLAPTRDYLVGQLKYAATALPPRRAADLVATGHRRLLVTAAAQEAQRVQRLQNIARRMATRRIRKGSTWRTLLKRGFQVQGLLRSPGRRVLRELTPKQIRVLFTLRNLAITARRLGLTHDERMRERM